MKLNIRDNMVFVRMYLDGSPLYVILDRINISYSTASDWGSMVREVMVNYVQRVMPNMKFQGKVQIDDSLFGRKTQYHRGAKKVY